MSIPHIQKIFRRYHSTFGSIAGFVLLGATLPCIGGSIFLDASTEGSQVSLATPYGTTIFIVQPGMNINPAFKVEDMQTNWSKDDLPGFSASADMEPIQVNQIPIVSLNGENYVGLGFDFNETGGSGSDFDIVNMIIWSSPRPVDTIEAGLATDPDLSSYSWSGNPAKNIVNSWENNLRQLESSSVGESLGLTPIYVQNDNPQIFVPNDTRPYDTDPNRIYANELTTLGSNAVEVGILVPASILDSLAPTDYLYIGVQTGSMNGGGSDRFGVMDPTSLVSGGFFDRNNIAVSSSVESIPEPSNLAFFSLAVLTLGLRRSRGA
jgi:hypothetical protein